MSNETLRSSPWERGPIARGDSPIFTVILLLALLGRAGGFARAQNVSIGTATANNSALLHLESTTLGFLIPRMTDAQMQAITTPATGNMVFDNTYTNFYYYNGTIWTPMVGSGWSLTGDAGTNASTNFLGTKDAVDLVQKTNGYERMRVFNGGDVGLRNTTNVAEKLQFFEPSSSGSTYTAAKAGIQAGTVHYILPSGDGTSNQALVTNAAGILSWHTFATFGGTGSQSLWKRGSAGGGEYSDSSGNSDSGPYSMAEGHNDNVTGNYEMVFGSGNSGVSGSYGTVHGGGSNGSTGDLDVVGGGKSNTASATASNIGGGSGNSTSGNEEVVLGGSGASFSGSNSTIIGGATNRTNGNYELVYGLNVTVGGGTGLAVFKIGTHTEMGINTVSPSEATDVVGNVKFSTALKPAGTAGTSGKFLLSAGAGAAPTWGTITVPATNWSLTGTTGSNPATNYIGTTDAQDLAIRTSNSERMRVLSTGEVGIGTSSPTNRLHIVSSSAADEVAALFANATGNSLSQSIGLWGRADNAGSSNTGTIAVLANGNGNGTAGTTNVASQISDGEFAMGRTTQAPSAGSVVEGAASGTLYTAQGPSGVIQLGMITDLAAAAPTSGVYQDLGTVTINNRYINANSIVLASIVAKTNGGGTPDPKNSVFKVDIESRAAGSCVIRIGMIPFVTDPGSYQGSDNIRLAYVVINPGK